MNALTSLPGFESLRALLERGVEEKIFPGGSLVYGCPQAGEFQTLNVGQEGVTRHRVPVGPETAYDLASLTKVASTATLAMLAVDKGLLALDAKIAELGLNPPEDLAALAVLDLLTHSSGLPAWRPYYANQLFAGKERLAAAILSERPLFPVGRQTLYSDLGLILMGLILEKAFNRHLLELFSDLVAKPLNLARMGFDGRALSPAPTEDGPRMGGPLDYPGVQVLGPVPTGRAHDDNAAFMGGAAGHAGLFGTALDLWRIIMAWSSSLNGRGAHKGRAGPNGAEPFISQKTIRDFITPRPTVSDQGRAVGFDLGVGPIAGAVGHLGYTGGSLWWDPERDKAIVFLCNRVHPTARNQKMPEFRTSLYKALG